MHDAELARRFSELYPGAVADTLDDQGYDEQVLPPSITPLTDDTTLAGIAYTVIGHPDPGVEYDANLRRFLRMLGEAPEHSIVAYQTNDDGAAHLGELSTTALAEQGCRGAVIDGGVRDVRFILDQEFPVFSRYRTPADAPPRWRLDDWNVPIEIGGVDVEPGDVLVGDVDGVVCVPRSIAEAVLEQAEAMVETESAVRDAVKDGVAPLDAYDEFGKF
jgi:regulator of RNase E activity RraA